MTTLKNDLRKVTDNHCLSDYPPVGKSDVYFPNIVYQVYTKKNTMGLTTVMQFLMFS